MLQLKNIVKEYAAGDQKVAALRGVSLSFRKSEFVCILGPSGCGKTTLLNIIGGLDQYTEGDLVISGRSTKDYRDGDWDVYRNRSIGFVFQSYNLIPHQTVLANVELALTLSGVSKAERRRRATAALEEVGLGDQLHKRHNQMSGGQMQRVAIARALVNNPEILLADEPTGALDSETSVQIMELLKEVSKDRLVVMVTHNPDLAEQYGTRIVRLLDGRVESDSMPYEEEQAEVKAGGRLKKRPMSHLTALSLSARNLLTKKGRTFLTAFAGSIGIIGIALILSLSTGIQAYIDQVQEDTLSSYPVTIEAETVDMNAMMISMMGQNYDEGEKEERAPDRVYSSTVMYQMLDAMFNAKVSTNNLKDFKTFLDNGGGGIDELATIRYSYDFPFDVYTKDEEGAIIKSDMQALIGDAMNAMFGGNAASMQSMTTMAATMNIWNELIPGDGDQLVADLVTDQYDVLYGRWPQSREEVVLFVDENNEISDLMLISLGLVPSSLMDEALGALKDGGTVDPVEESWSYEELCSLQYKLILPAERYQFDAATGGYVDMSATDKGMELLYNSADVGLPLKVVGIVRPSEDATSTMVTGAIGYTSALTTYAIEKTQETDVVKAQLEDETLDVFVNLPFLTDDYVEPTDEEKKTEITAYLQGLSANEKAQAYLDVMSQPSDEYVEMMVQQQMAELTREDIEAMIVQQYAAEMGVDAETIMGYIAEMSDEELFEQVRTAAREMIREQYIQGVQAQMSAMPNEQLAGAMDLVLSGNEQMMQATGMKPFETWQYNYLYENYMPPVVSEATFEENMDALGYVDLASPSSINIYAATFADKDLIADEIQAYNASVSEDDEINYTDYVAILMSSITTIINAISYVLIAFVAISLVVSSIMIGIITYISVLERTKEIGILRAIGASKKDVSRVFNAETLIVGLTAGAIGIGVTLLLIIPINAIVQHLTGIASLRAQLPAMAGVILVGISMALTFIAGLIPSRLAAKKDPVTALHTE